MAVQGFLRYTANVEWFKEGRRRGLPFPKGGEILPEGEALFMEGPGGGGDPFDKGKKFAQRWAAECGGIRGSSDPPP